MTDGVFYDMPRPQIVFDAMREQLDVFSYAVAVAYAALGNGSPGVTGDKPGSTGFTPAQLEKQREQLEVISGFTANGTSRAYIVTTSKVQPNPWQQVFDLTSNLSFSLLQEVELAKIGHSDPGALGRASYCGYVVPQLCSQPFNARYCKYTGTGPYYGCAPLSTCTMYDTAVPGVSLSKQKARCAADRFCKLEGNACFENALKLPMPVTNHTALCDTLTSSSAACTAPKDARGFPVCYWFNVTGDPTPPCKSY